MSGACEIVIRTLARTQSKQVKEGSLTYVSEVLKPPPLASSQVSEPHLRLDPRSLGTHAALTALQRARGQRL